jgi:P-type E1-E2 ATPase
MMHVAVSSEHVLELAFLVLDVNGTVALDGQLLTGVKERLLALGGQIDIWLISADTHGTLDRMAAEIGVQARRIRTGGEATQKAALVNELGAAHVVAIGNGVNDASMLHLAILGIAVMGEEGLTAECLFAADLVAPSILAALDLFLKPRRLMATLRA